MGRILALLLLLSLVGCSRPSGGDEAAGVQLTARTTPAPARVGDNQLQVELQGGQAKNLTVEATMSHPGMAPVMATLSPGQNNTWQAPLKLTMAGDWVLIVRGELSDGRKLERQIPLPGVVSGP